MKSNITNMSSYSLCELSSEEMEQTNGGFSWAGGGGVFNQLGNWAGQAIEATVNAFSDGSILNGLQAIKG